jgi:sec-independent protein translocase protein TatA
MFVFPELRLKFHRMTPGPYQIILVLLVVLLLFGGRKIPELMKGLGRGVKEFKDATQDDGKSGDEGDKS